MISPLLIGRINQHYVTVFSRRFNRPDGQFAGVALATISLDYFSRLIARYDVGAHGGIALRDARLALMVRLPPVRPELPLGEIGNRRVSPELRRAVESGVGMTTFRSSGDPEGSECVVTMRRLENAPIIVIVALTSADYLADWLVEAQQMILLATSVVLVSFISAFALLRLIRQAELHEQEIRELAFYDALTGLPSHRLCADRLEMTLNQIRRQGEQAGVMFIDLDGFKAVNDAHGHQAGDEVLKRVAQRLDNTIRTVDTVARAGGDEFLVVLGALHGPGDASEVAEKIIAAVGEPIAFREHQLRVGCSIGISVFPKHAGDAEELRRTADVAMYFVKRSGRNNYAFYRADGDMRTGR